MLLRQSPHSYNIDLNMNHHLGLDKHVIIYHMKVQEWQMYLNVWHYEGFLNKHLNLLLNIKQS
jgi:hypothetical protein